MPILQPKYETMQPDELEQLQFERLQIILNRALTNVAFYRKLFEEQQIEPHHITSIKDIKKLPFTTRDDVQKSSPYNMFAVPLRDIVRVHSTAGTRGTPVGVGYTKNDIKLWSILVARLMTAAGVNEHDFVQIAFPYGLMTGGFGFHYGAELIGASVIPASAEDIHDQIAIMKNFKTTVLIGRPGYALAIAKVLTEMQMPAETLYLRCGIFGSEPWSEEERKQIETLLKIKAYDSYGLSEVIGPGIAGECEQQNGLHINEDHFLAEIIDPATGTPLPQGEEGELVLTTLSKEAFPLIRYRTGDLTRIIDEPCQCGRTFRRIARVKGRTDDLIFFGGVKFFPSQIQEILLQENGISPNLQIVLGREHNTEFMTIHVEITDKFPGLDEVKALEALRERLSKRIEQNLKIKTQIRLVPPYSTPRAEEKKLIRVIDRRKT